MLGKEDVCDVRRRSVVCNRQAGKQEDVEGRAEQDKIYINTIHILYILNPFAKLIYIMINPKYRVDFELVGINSLTKIQAKINQWITKGELASYKWTALPDGNILFEFCRIKSTEE